jgi:hypothetical protein
VEQLLDRLVALMRRLARTTERDDVVGARHAPSMRARRGSGLAAFTRVRRVRYPGMRAGSILIN